MLLPQNIALKFTSSSHIHNHSNIYTCIHTIPQTTFKGRVFMTHATKAIYRWLLSDYIKVRYLYCEIIKLKGINKVNVHSNIGADEMLYSEKDLEKSMDKIETINFHQASPMHNLSYSFFFIHSFPHSSIPGGGCKWNQILVLQCRPCAWCCNVHDRDSRSENILHWRLLL